MKKKGQQIVLVVVCTDLCTPPPSKRNPELLAHAFSLPRFIHFDNSLSLGFVDMLFCKTVSVIKLMDTYPMEGVLTLCDNYGVLYLIKKR